ncbi:unnamed protein product [Penicillium nalgiovense]|nr:unnamed protein product [Penicillium nalgiovense]CAG7979594.1 unnamed protein product [Penicillium nalgiovense]CAG8051685.1 unnamed protein product [Penicillium nalgiovense]CAG8058260.1 unnamed protein product [Penicillium nalgiovense]CAG8230231.1 unnamed protein product [Penicillium nalgiovense]
MSSLTPGHVLRGARWNYRVLEPFNGDGTHISTVFKAQVVPRERVVPEVEVPEWSLIKVALPGDEIATKNMQREVLTYRLPDVASAECFRKMYDIIDDSTLAEVKYCPNMHIYSLAKSFLRAAFTSCVVLENYEYVNTDYKPANILLSGIRTDRVIAKVVVGFIVVPVGELINAQPYAMRASEVFLGKVCTEPSQVWAVAAMLLSWIKPGVLGTWDSPLLLSTPETDLLKVTVKSARSLSEGVPELQAILPLDEETKKVEMPQQLRDLLRFILVPDPKLRPSASSVLASSEFQEFENYVRE